MSNQAHCRLNRYQQNPWAIVSVVIVLWIMWFPSTSQGMLVGSTGRQLVVLPDSALRNIWKVTHVSLDTTSVGTTGYLVVQNLTDSGQIGHFYAEYLDRDGRFVFSLVFSENKNTDGKSGMFTLGEARTLYSIASLISPASEPMKARVFWVASGEVSSAISIHVRAPATVQITTDNNDRVHIPGFVTQSTEQVVDVALANVVVDSSGHLQNVTIIHSINPEMNSWFSELVAKQIFFAATLDTTSVPGSTLLLLRILSPAANHVGVHTPSPTVSRWVQDYISRTGNMSLPPLTTIVLTRPPTRVKAGGSNDWTELPPAPAGVFEPVEGASVWCPDVAKWVHNSNGSLRRELFGEEPHRD